MSRFGMIVEDPNYDEDGQLMDEDDWSSAPIDASELEEMNIDSNNFDPFDTVNS